MTQVDLFETLPFDTLRRTDEHGERWTSRDLMPVMGYLRWEDFRNSVDRARAAIVTSGEAPELHASEHSEPVTNRGNTPNTVRMNYRFTR